jgi:hypothetical protein
LAYSCGESAPVCFDIGTEKSQFLPLSLCCGSHISCEMAAMEEESKSEPKAQTKTLFEPNWSQKLFPSPSQKPTQHEARQTTVRNDTTEVTQTPTVDLRPEREITMDRVRRFCEERNAPDASVGGGAAAGLNLAAALRWMGHGDARSTLFSIDT